MRMDYAQSKNKLIRRVLRNKLAYSVKQTKTIDFNLHHN